MRKILIFFLILLFFGLGVFIGQDDKPSFNIYQEQLNEFEDNIENNEYQSTYNKIKPNIFNKLGRKLDKFIDKGFGKIFNYFK